MPRQLWACVKCGWQFPAREEAARHEEHCGDICSVNYGPPGLSDRISTRREGQSLPDSTPVIRAERDRLTARIPALADELRVGTWAAKARARERSD